MTQKIPQFYQRWIRIGLGISESSAFAYHSSEEYAYLTMGGPEDAPGSLFVFVFLNPDKKRKYPEFLKMHRIQASEVDSCEEFRYTLKKVA